MGNIGILLNRSVEMIESILGIAMAGGVYVPIDPGYPAERIAFILKDAMISGVIADGLPLKLEAPASAIFDIHLMKQGVLPEDMKFPVRTLNSPAYIMYTSGSTGTPKGVVIPDRGIIRLVKNTNYVEVHPGDVFAHLSNPSFDASTFEIWGPLLNGASLAIVDNETRISPGLFSEFLVRYGVTTMFLTTSLFNVFSAYNPTMFQTCTTVYFGGEAAEPKAVCRVLANKPPKALVNAYGPTENTTFSTYYPVPATSNPDGEIPIGKPISNSEVYILNEQLQPTTSGELGEIYLGGDGLALGYFNNPVLTEERFRMITIGGRTIRLYKTGDLGYFMPDGTIFFKGRIDDQVKIHGFRIEPQEIQSVILHIQGVRECVVLATENGPTGKTLNIFYAVQPGYSVTPEAIRSTLAISLPDFMVHFPLFQLEQMPITGNGKIDRDALRVFALEKSKITKKNEKVQNSVTEMLIEEWKEFFKIDHLTETDSFFNLGGDSLSAIHMMYRLNEKFSIELPIRTLYDHPKLKNLAEVIQSRYNAVTAEQKKETIIPINISGTEKPIFFIPPFVNYSGHFMQIGKLVGSQHPAYTFEPHDDTFDRNKPLSIETIARTYLTFIREIQPAGPYYLCGWSMGGVIAFEMVRQLNAAGDTNSKLFLIDASPLTKYYGHKTVPLAFFPFVFLSRVFIRPGYLKEAQTFAAKALGAVLRKCKNLLQPVTGSRNNNGKQEGKLSAEDFLSASNETTHNRWKPFLEAYSNYIPAKIYCQTLCVWAKDHYNSTAERLLIQYFSKYKRYCKGSFSHALNGGSHGSVLQEPHYKDLAEQLIKFIKST